PGEPPLRRPLVESPRPTRRAAHRGARPSVRIARAPSRSGTDALRRHAPCGRPRPRHAARAAGVVPGRADRRPRPACPPLAVGADRPAAPGVRPDGVPHHALRGGGRAVRPRRRDGSRPAGGVGDARRVETYDGRNVSGGGVPRAHRPCAGRDGSRVSMRAVYGIVVRELVRFLRQRGRVLASIGRPFVWLIFAGAGYAAVFAGRNEIDYRVYMAPGLLGMVVMFGALLAALSTVTDRDAAVPRMVLVAPIRRGTIALG